MRTIILTGVLDYQPQLAICHNGDELRGVLEAWLKDLVPDLDFAGADPRRIEDAIDEAMAPSDWTALECFPLTDDGLAFTGDTIGIGLALACYAEDEGSATADPGAAPTR